MEWLTLLAIALSPLIAVLVSLWLQARKEKRDRKNHIFTTLMAHRKTNPPAQEWVSALNLIDVAFDDNKKVLSLWHEYYALLGSAQNQNEYRDREHKYIELLSVMAKDLGYKQLQQTDIDKFYSPQVYADQAQRNLDIQSELLRVLKSTNQIIVDPRPENDGT